MDVLLPRHLTERELALRWNCTTKKLQYDRSTGRGCAFIKLGQLVRYPLAAIEAYEREHTHLSTYYDVQLSEAS